MSVIEGVPIIYQDSHILLLDKPANLLSVPGRLPQHKDSLALRAQAVYPEARIVHRLDCATSGVMIMALDAETHRNLSKQFQERVVAKTYIADCYGFPETEMGSVEAPLMVDWPNRPRSKVDHENGKPALTHWKVLEHKQHGTRMELTPITGRSHQLRIHMAHMGHPILGDPFYAHEQALILANRLLLHARDLTIKHPVDGRSLSFTSPLPF